MAANALRFILETLGQLWILAVLLRFFSQALRAPFRARAGNPLADFILALTDWAVLPARRFIPSVAKFDMASLLVAWFAATLLSLAILALLGRVDIHSLASPVFWPALIFYGLIEITKLSLYLFIGLLIIQAMLSWLSSFHPLQPFFAILTRPLLRPIQRIIPPIGGVDLSLLFAIIILQVLLMVPVMYLGGEALLMVSRAGGAGG